ncbi:glycerophosphoryl diester phosphodiesterase [Sphingobium sp. OAS761]|uniref:glycerophosphodiester phosphodiesterase family protein n=1 Tax=Sphingobium sp. OAS761 TaxID=2817901 RepID=UPI0026464834|nr:glycerophosphodiester phosphodiesterase family protein [Sphingobium sp. OAS761]MCP1469901.1 glycerophosphoryl diester phosphodiesterase [Sphingobium sp. OAS761]
MSGPRPDRAFLTARPFAHRGLHGPCASENGMAAFDAAITAGFGIECDARASRDGVAFLFHDAGMARMTGRDDRIAALDAVAIDAITLPDGGTIPRLSGLLARCGGRVPLLVEIKAPDRQVGPLCMSVARAADAWPGAPVAVMSFNPAVGRWFARHRPATVRGLVVTAQGKGVLRGRVERTLALLLAKPDFLACDIRDLPSSFTRRARARGLPVLSWTVRTDAERARASVHADQMIFERPHD